MQIVATEMDYASAYNTVSSATVTVNEETDRGIDRNYFLTTRLFTRRKFNVFTQFQIYATQDTLTPYFMLNNSISM